MTLKNLKHYLKMNINKGLSSFLTPNEKTLLLSVYVFKSVGRETCTVKDLSKFAKINLKDTYKYINELEAKGLLISFKYGKYKEIII